MAITFVMPVYNARRTVREALDAVLQAAEWWGNASVVVVDNGSTDGSRELIQATYGDRVTLLDDPNATIGHLRNLGARARNGDYLAFIDSDCVIEEEYCRAAAAALAEPGAGAAGSTYSVARPAHWIEETWNALHRPPAPGPAEWLPGGNLVVRRMVFEEVGGFDTTLATGEDVDLCRRIRAAGHTIYRDPAIAAVHLGNPRTIRAFLRQHWWHGIGAITGALRGAPLPFAMSMVHLALTILSFIALVRTPGLPAVGGLVVGQAVVPVAAVTYRIRKGGRASNLPVAVLLYWLYFLARIAAVGSATIGLPRPSRGRR